MDFGLGSLVFVLVNYESTLDDPKTKGQSPKTILVVRKGGLEPPHLSVPDPKSGASANSATFAYQLEVAALRQRARIACSQSLSHKARTSDILPRRIPCSPNLARSVASTATK